MNWIDELVKEIDEILKLESVDSIDVLAKKGLITEKCRNEIEKVFKKCLKNTNKLRAYSRKRKLPASESAADTAIGVIYDLMPSLRE